MSARLECDDCGRLGAVQTVFRGDGGATYAFLMPPGWRAYGGRPYADTSRYVAVPGTTSMVRAGSEVDAVRCPRCVREYEETRKGDDAAAIAAYLAAQVSQ